MVYDVQHAQVHYPPDLMFVITHSIAGLYLHPTSCLSSHTP